MTDVESKAKPSSGKGKAFFDRADQVAETGNWDFAIELYLGGIACEPTNLERGHQPLREVSLKRKAQRGKSASLVEQFKRRGGKDPIEALVNAEYLLARDPGSVSHKVAVFKAATNIDDPGLTNWICTLLLEAMRHDKRPNKRICIMIAEAFGAIEAYSSAVEACDVARAAYPNDGLLARMAKDYSAKGTIQDGRYDREGSFVESVRDMDAQVELAQSDQKAQSREFIEKEIEKARAEYQASPTVPGKIDALADALLKIEEEGYENEAIDILKKARADTNAYRFKMRVDDVLVRQMRRRISKLKSQGEKQAGLKETKKLLAFELKMYAERAANYPTDLSVKFELGRRQLVTGQIDEAIASLQQAQRDPKRRIQALSLLGKAFAKKGWHREAVDTYQRALELEPTEERTKELNYNLAGSLQAMGEDEKALEHLSRVAQLDYNYRDVREQIEALRAKVG